MEQIQVTNMRAHFNAILLLTLVTKFKHVLKIFRRCILEIAYVKSLGKRLKGTRTPLDSSANS